MADTVDMWSAAGQKNIFGNTVKVVEMQSEAGAAGTVHGSLAAGALTTTFTASQGLLLMIPNMYKIAAEQLPCVFDVSARTVSTQSLNIFGDHSDVYACRQTGFAMLAETNPQEVMDLSPVAHLAALEGKVPFINFFDGFRTSHEIQKIEKWDYEDLKEMCPMDAVEEFRAHALNPEHPAMRGSHENGDVFFQHREACNTVYDALPAVVEKYMGKVNEKLGTDYDLFNYYGAPDADRVIIAMGSICDVAEEVIDYLTAKGEKVGLIKVRLYRPWSSEHILKAIPKTAKKIAVLDRTKEPGSLGEPLFIDVATTLREAGMNDVVLTGGRYGLGSKDTPPSSIFAIYKELEKDAPKARFTIGIVDDVTNLSLPEVKPAPITSAPGTKECKFWGLGGDGTVGANKNSTKIIGDHTDKYIQAYFQYDSKKTGGITISHLRFGDNPIKSPYYINQADFVACHNQSYIDKYNMVQDIKPGGTFLLNCQWSKDEVEQYLPGQVKRYLAENNIKFYIIDGVDIARKIGLGNRTSTVLQSAFFKLAKIIPEADAIKYMKEKALASFGKKGDDVVKMNYDAIDAGAKNVIEVSVPDSWKSCKDSKMGMPKAKGDRKDLVNYVNNIQIPVNAQMGDTLPVSAFKNMPDGTFPQGSAAYEKRGIAVDVPSWNPDNCIQCNFCSYVCPHAVIRPVVMTDDELKSAPNGTTGLKIAGLDKMNFVMTVSALDCTGCGSCANVCPGKKGEKALTMKPLAEQIEKQNLFAYGQELPEKKEIAEKFKETTVKGSQFKQPLLEFSGACAGCGETPYAKLVTQLFGDRMFIANATGCSSIWGGSAPSTPYTVNKEGKGPAWANSLFEDNAEYGYGMFLAQNTLRQRAVAKLLEMQKSAKGGMKTAIENYMSTMNDGNANKAATAELIKALEGSKSEAAAEVLELKDYLGKKSMWVFGGDGWAYDIGFSGLDHVIASGEDVNIFVFDTEVYSNTGGQSSKSTPTGAIAQFAAAGKETKKKDLAGIAMSYGYVYVAHIAMGADMNQCIKAITEAEAYNGPSLIIAYAPCINHGIKAGMSKAMDEEKKAVEAGYWHLYRYNPALKDEGKNPFSLDSKVPAVDEKYKDFLMGEVRYNALARQNPERADMLFSKAVNNAKDRYDYLTRLTKLYGTDEK
jgi:pyruvate-ferredoxin/flavodoxin oxidoreductase